MSASALRREAAAPFHYTKTAPGLGQYSNGDVALCGGTRSLSLGPSGTERLRFAIYDLAMMANGATRAEAGFAEVNVVRGSRRFEGLGWIEISRPFRRRGIATRVVRALAATADKETLRIYGIDRRALDFWDSVGCVFEGSRGDRYLDGRIKAQSFR